MNKKAIILSLTLCIALIVGMYVFAYLWREEYRRAAYSEEVATSMLSPIATASAPHEISAIHSYSEETGAHTIQGFVPTDAACSAVTYSIVSSEGTARTRILFEDHELPQESCSNPQALREFSISFNAMQDTQIEAAIGEKEVPLILTESTSTTAS